MLQTPSPSVFFDAALSPCCCLYYGAEEILMVSLYFSKSPVFNFLKTLLRQDWNLPSGRELLPVTVIYNCGLTGMLGKWSVATWRLASACLPGSEVYCQGRAWVRLYPVVPMWLANDSICVDEKASGAGAGLVKELWESSQSWDCMQNGEQHSRKAV